MTYRDTHRLLFTFKCIRICIYIYKNIHFDVHGLFRCAAPPVWLFVELEATEALQFQSLSLIEKHQPLARDQKESWKIGALFCARINEGRGIVVSEVPPMGEIEHSMWSEKGSDTATHYSPEMLSNGFHFSAITQTGVEEILQISIQSIPIDSIMYKYSS